MGPGPFRKSLGKFSRKFRMLLDLSVRASDRPSDCPSDRLSDRPTISPAGRLFFGKPGLPRRIWDRLTRGMWGRK